LVFVGACIHVPCFSAVAGVVLGLMPGTHRLGEVADPILSSFYTIPKVTLYPVMLLIFGIGMSAKVAFGVIRGVIPAMLFTTAAVKNIPPVLLRTARVLRLSQRKRRSACQHRLWRQRSSPGCGSVSP